MANNFAQPVRMESQYVDTKLFNVFYQEGGQNAEVEDGTLVVLGGFPTDPVYSTAYTAAGAADQAPVDFNCRIATKPAAVTDTEVCLIDLATVPTAIAGKNAYRVGANTVGLVAPAGTPVRARKLVKDDTFAIGEGNCTAALTQGQYATINTDGKFVPAATAPTTDGAYFYVVRKYTLSQGVTGGTVAYTLCVEAN